MIKKENYQPHERKLVEALSSLDNVSTVSDADASMIIGMNRRMCPKPFEVVSRIQWIRFGPRPIFVQNGRYHRNPDEIDFSKPFWAVVYSGKESEKGTPLYAVSNCC